MSILRNMDTQSRRASFFGATPTPSSNSKRKSLTETKSKSASKGKSPTETKSKSASKGKSPTEIKSESASKMESLTEKKRARKKIIGNGLQSVANWIKRIIASDLKLVTIRRGALLEIIKQVINNLYSLAESLTNLQTFSHRRISTSDLRPGVFYNIDETNVINSPALFGRILQQSDMKNSRLALVNKLNPRAEQLEFVGDEIPDFTFPSKAMTIIFPVDLRGGKVNPLFRNKGFKIVLTLYIRALVRTMIKALEAVVSKGISKQHIIQFSLLRGLNNFERFSSFYKRKNNEEAIEHQQAIEHLYQVTNTHFSRRQHTVIVYQKKKRGRTLSSPSQQKRKKNVDEEEPEEDEDEEEPEEDEDEEESEEDEDEEESD